MAFDWDTWLDNFIPTMKRGDPLRPKKPEGSSSDTKVMDMAVYVLIADNYDNQHGGAIPRTVQTFRSFQQAKDVVQKAMENPDELDWEEGPRRVAWYRRVVDVRYELWMCKLGGRND